MNHHTERSGIRFGTRIEEHIQHCENPEKNRGTLEEHPQGTIQDGRGLRGEKQKHPEWVCPQEELADMHTIHGLCRICITARLPQVCSPRQSHGERDGGRERWMEGEIEVCCTWGCDKWGESVK